MEQPDIHQSRQPIPQTCGQCGATNRVESQFLELYLGKNCVCSGCGVNFDTFAAFEKTLQTRTSYNTATAHSWVGFSSYIVKFSLKIGEEKYISFHTPKITEKSKFLRIHLPQEKSYTGGCCPSLVGDSHLVEAPEGFRVYGKPIEGSESSDSEDFVGLVTWIDDNNDFSRSLIHQAIEACASGLSMQGLIAAQGAVELRLFQLITEAMKNQVSNKRLKEFLESSATYSSQVNVLLPYISHLNNLPIMADQLRGRLNSARQMRNDVAHASLTTQPDNALVHSYVASCIVVAQVLPELTAKLKR